VLWEYYFMHLKIIRSEITLFADVTTAPKLLRIS